MHAIRTGISALGCFDAHADDDSIDNARQESLKLIAQIPIITAYFHCLRRGKTCLESDPALGEAANFLYLIDGEKPSRDKEKTLDLCYVLHADHGMNASTFSARVTIATLSDVYSAITTAIGTLKGPLHGGANEGVIKMLREIGSVDKVDAYIAEALAQKRKIMGIGHRVYKTLDPRAPHLKKMAQTLSAQLGEPKWIQMSERIAEILFGLIMALTVTGATSVVTADRTQIRTMLIAALGCNIAWGIIDAGMYLMDRLAERGSNALMLREVRGTADRESANRAIADALPPPLASTSVVE